MTKFMGDFFHVTTVNSDGTEGRGWAVPVGIWSDIEYAVHFGAGRESYGQAANIDTYAANTLYGVKAGKPSLRDTRIWGYHEVQKGVYRYGYLDDHEYPHGYDEYLTYLKLRKEFQTEDEIKSDADAKRHAEHERIVSVMPTDLVAYAVVVPGVGRMGDYKSDAEFLRGLFIDLSSARTKARGLARSTKGKVFVYELPVNKDLGNRGFFDKDNLKASYDGAEDTAAVKDKKAEFELLRKRYS